MKKYSSSILIAILVTFVALFILSTKNKNLDTSVPDIKQDVSQTTSSQEILDMVNPASKYCEENGGQLVMINNKDGSQLGMCKFEDYECEEWAFYRDECNIEEDAEAIYKALEDKGLNLDNMKVEIYKHMGQYIEGGVVPILARAGGGYVFAEKSDGTMKIVADGNGSILCEYLEEYPDFPEYLISECVGNNGNIVTR